MAVKNIQDELSRARALKKLDALATGSLADRIMRLEAFIDELRNESVALKPPLRAFDVESAHNHGIDTTVVDRTRSPGVSAEDGMASPAVQSLARRVSFHESPPPLYTLATNSTYVRAIPQVLTASTTKPFSPTQIFPRGLIHARPKGSDQPEDTSDNPKLRQNGQKRAAAQTSEEAASNISNNNSHMKD